MVGVHVYTRSQMAIIIPIYIFLQMQAVVADVLSVNSKRYTLNIFVGETKKTISEGVTSSLLLLHHFLSQLA